MIAFELAEPRSLSESITLLDRDDPAIRPIAGGTALMLMMKAGFFKPIRLVSLRRIEPRYSRIATADDGTLRIGAMATLADLEDLDALRRHAPVIAGMMRDVANVRVRNVATVGGNLAHADPHLDLPPVWIALAARIVIAGAAGERTIPVDALFSGYYETTLHHNELITEVILPPQANRRSVYLKCMARSAHDWPAIGVAVSFALKDGVIDEPRIAIGGATAIPTRLAAVEAVLRGARVDEPLLARAADAADAEADIVGDQHGSAPYKRQLLRVYLARAVKAALEAPMAETPMPSGQVGRTLPRLESRAKVTGRAEYTHHLRLPGMLTGKIFRSSVPHGRIKRIDVTAAAALAGVHRVVTCDDIRAVIPNPYYGPAFHDQPILADGKVRFAGEPVAVVLAEDAHIAEEAAGLIVAEYEELPAIFDEREAGRSTAIVHETLKPAATFPDLKHLQGRKDTNIALEYHLRRGDTATAFAAADRVFEHTFRTQQVMHTPLEPFVAVAEPGDGRITLHTASQNPSFVRIEIARLLGWPENRVRVKVPHLGGGFGGKLYIKLEALVTALALLVRRPVKIALTMEEQFFMVTRHPATMTLKSAVTKDGRITARACEIWWNGGAYADIGPRVTQKAGFTSAGPYDIDHVTIDSYAAYTNRPPAGALRGFGAPQTCWAYERHTDLIARALGIDPIEFRRRNLLRNGRPQATGTIVRDAALIPVLDRLAERMKWDQAFARGNGRLRRGRGIAIGFKGITAPTASVAILNLYGDGSCGLYIGTVDMGQGSDTVMAQIAGEVLNIPAETVTVIHPDTDVTPYDMGTLGSRSTFHMGNAVRLAAEDAKNKVAALAAELGLPPASNLPIAELFRRKYGMQAGNIVGVGSFMPNYVSPDHATGQSPMATPFWGVAGSGAEVEVDTETGQFRVTRLVNIADVGTPINPRLVQAQLSGAAIMQFGFTVSEEMLFTEGQLTNGSLADYKIPNLLDLPRDFLNETVEATQQDGPFGAKGAGESTTMTVSPAIGNAIEDAVGIGVTELPLTAERIFRGLRANAGNPLPDR